VYHVEAISSSVYSLRDITRRTRTLGANETRGVRVALVSLLLLLVLAVLQLLQLLRLLQLLMPLLEAVSQD